MTAAQLKPDEIYTRSEVRALMGGSEQGGIVPSTSSNTILIYSDDEAGKRYGYLDGWLDEEDADGAIFEYTGAGNHGDQTFDGQYGGMNKAVLNHAAADRTLHVFKAVGKVPNTGTKTHRYVGEMALDEDRPYYVRQARDEAGDQRKVIVFRMRAADGRAPEAKDRIPPASTTMAVLVPADVTTSSIVPTERAKTKSSKRSGSALTTAERREAELTDHYEAFLAKRGHAFGRFQIKVKGTTTTLLTDIYDQTAHVLHEAKGGATRKAVREAIGQLMDYRRHVTPPNPVTAILLPARPHDDLQDLIASTGIALIYRERDNYVGYPASPAPSIN
jgi:5-methylcytosine-specific restriction protein A